MMKLFESDFIIKNNGKDYLADIISNDQYDDWFRKNTITILNKTHCGNGGTTGFINYCINEFRGSLILVPNRSITIDKESEYRANEQVCCVYGGSDVIDVNATVVIATYDQFKRLLKELADHGMDGQDRFWAGRTIIIDEYHKLIDESSFRDICFDLTELIKTTENGCILMSATPHYGYVEMLREYCDKEVKTYTVEYDYDEWITKRISFFEVNKKEIAHILQKTKKHNDHVCVFYSSVTDIKNILNRIGDDDVEVLCSEVNKKELGKYYSDKFDENKKLHFMTSAYFTGMDIRIKVDQCIIVGSPVGVNMCYSDRDVKQMIGRFRNGVVGEDYKLFYIWSNFEKNGYTEIKSNFDRNKQLLEALGDNWKVNNTTVAIRQEFLNQDDIIDRFNTWKDKNGVIEMLKGIGYNVVECKIGDFDLVQPKKKIGFKTAKKKIIDGQIITYDDYQYANIMCEYHNVFGSGKLELASLRDIKNWWKIYKMDSEYNDIVNLQPNERFNIVFGDGLYTGSYIRSALEYVGCKCEWDEINNKMMEEYGCWCMIEKKDRHNNRNNDLYVVMEKIGTCTKNGTGGIIRKSDFSVPNMSQKPKINYFIKYDDQKHSLSGTFNLDNIQEYFSSLKGIKLYDWINQDKATRLPERKSDKEWKNIKNYNQSKITELYKETDKVYRQQIQYLDKIDSIIVDIDEGLSFSEFKDRYEDFTWTAYPTISNVTEDWTKFRVIIPLKNTLILTGKNNLKVLKVLRRYFCPFEDQNHNLCSYVNKEDWNDRFQNDGEVLDIPQEIVDYITIVMDNLQDFTYRRKYVKADEQKVYFTVEQGFEILKKIYDSKIDNVMHSKTYWVKKNIEPEHWNEMREKLFELNRSVVKHWDSHRIAV